MDLLIKDRNAVITGSASGIGIATAKVLAGEGLNVILNDKSSIELEKAAEEVRFCKKNNNSIVTLSADLTKNEEVLTLANQAKKEFGGIDIVVNCAGIRGAADDFLKLTDEDWYNTIDIDLMGAVRICRAFISPMQEKGWGRIVLIASENASQPYEKESPYNACKAGIINLIKCLSKSCSEQVSYVTGSNYRVDGGSVATAFG